MTTELDLAVINTFMRDAATRAVAEAIRAQTSQLAVLGDPNSASRLVVRDDPRQPEMQALSSPLRVSEPRAYTEVYPVPIERPDEPLGWWARYWHRVAIALGAATVVGLLIWGILALISMLVSAAARTAVAAAPAVGTVGTILVLAILGALLFGGKAKDVCAGLHCGGCGK